MEEAARAATSSVWPIKVSHNWRPKDSRMATRAWPPSVALSSLARCRTRRTATAARVSVVAAEPLSELLLPKLFWFVQSNDKLLIAQISTVHRVHRSRS